MEHGQEDMDKCGIVLEYKVSRHCTCGDGFRSLSARIPCGIPQTTWLPSKMDGQWSNYSRQQGPTPSSTFMVEAATCTANFAVNAGINTQGSPNKNLA